MHSLPKIHFNSNDTRNKINNIHRRTMENTIDAVCQHRAGSVELIAKYLSILGNNQRAERGILNILQIQLAFG